MNITHQTISQQITAVVAYKDGSALVRLANNRVAIVSGETLSKSNINPADGPANQCLATRISVMREGLEGKHASLKRDSRNLYVTRILTAPLTVPVINADIVAEICTEASVNRSLSQNSQSLWRYIQRSPNAQHRAWAAEIRAAMAQGRSDPRLSSLRESLIAAHAA